MVCIYLSGHSGNMCGKIFEITKLMWFIWRALLAVVVVVAVVVAIATYTHIYVFAGTRIHHINLVASKLPKRRTQFINVEHGIEKMKWKKSSEKSS